VDTAIVEAQTEEREAAEAEREHIAREPVRPPSGGTSQRARMKLSVRMQTAMRTLKFLNDNALAEAPPGADAAALPEQLRALMNSLGRWDKGRPIPGLDSLVRELSNYCAQRKALSSHFCLGGDVLVFETLDDVSHLQRLRSVDDDGNTRPRNFSEGLMKAGEI
jgi:hypothetical protein